MTEKNKRKSISNLIEIWL